MVGIADTDNPTKRLFADDGLATYLKVDRERLGTSQADQTECFYKMFPPTVHGGEKQTDTLHWIYARTADGRGVVTPSARCFAGSPRSRSRSNLTPG